MSDNEIMKNAVKKYVPVGIIFCFVCMLAVVIACYMFGFVVGLLSLLTANNLFSVIFSWQSAKVVLLISFSFSLVISVIACAGVIADEVEMGISVRDTMLKNSEE